MTVEHAYAVPLLIRLPGERELARGFRHQSGRLPGSTIVTVVTQPGALVYGAEPDQAEVALHPLQLIRGGRAIVAAQHFCPK